MTQEILGALAVSAIALAGGWLIQRRRGADVASTRAIGVVALTAGAIAIIVLLGQLSSGFDIALILSVAIVFAGAVLAVALRKASSNDGLAGVPRYHLFIFGTGLVTSILLLIFILLQGGTT